MIVGITPEYCQQVLDLLTNSWPDTRRIFKVRDIQKLVGKVACLGKGAPWIDKIILHVSTSLACALKQNDLLLHTCLPKFCNIIDKIERKQFSDNQHEFTKELSFTLKTASKMLDSHSQVYLINETMRKELNQKNLGVPITFIILKTLTASLFGDSLLLSCGGYF